MTEKKTKKKTGRIGIAMILAVTVFCTTSIHSYAEKDSSTEQKIRDADAVLDQLENSKAKADAKVEKLNQKKTELSAKLTELDNNLKELSDQIETTTQKLEKKKAEIKKTKKDLKCAKQKAKKQYKDMKQRIRFIYENGSETYIEALVSAQSFAEMLNKSEYVNAINQYDRTMLDSYNQTVNQIEKDEKALVSQKKEMEKIKKDLDAQEREIENILEQTQKTMSENNTALADAKENAKQLKKKYKAQKEYEAQLEKQKAEEDARRLEEIRRKEQEAAQRRAAEEKAKKNAGSNAQPQVSTGPVAASDVEMLAALLQCEAGGENYEGKLAVGSVVMNRVASPSFPSTLAGVIYQGGQFSPVASGRYAAVLATGGASGECRSAAQEVLGGHITNSFLYFRSASSGMGGTRIGNNIFY
ncbi:MAG: cell wall hydrolase [Lachnospiraceae bacterium]